MSGISSVQQAEARFAVVQQEENVRSLGARIVQLNTELNRVDDLWRQFMVADNTWTQEANYITAIRKEMEDGSKTRKLTPKAEAEFNAKIAVHERNIKACHNKFETSITAIQVYCGQTGNPRAILQPKRDAIMQEIALAESARRVAQAQLDVFKARAGT